MKAWIIPEHLFHLSKRGVVAMLSKRLAVKLANSKELMQGFFQRPLGNGVLATIDSLRAVD